MKVELVKPMDVTTEAEQNENVFAYGGDHCGGAGCGVEW